MADRQVAVNNDGMGSKIEKPRFKKAELFVKGSFDIPFLAITMLLLTIGLIMLFSASYPYSYYYKDNSYYYFIRQFIFAVAGVIAMFIMSKINYRIIKAFAMPLLVITLLLLVVVLFWHTNVSDTEDFRRWIPLGPFTLQPSDIAKFTITVTFAAYISKCYAKMGTFKYGVFFPALIIGVFCGLIMLEHHLSCTILMFGIGACLMWVGGTDWKLFALGLGLFFAVAFIVVKFPDILPSYAAERIHLWLDKDMSPTDGRWQTNNSLMAIGSGGLFGTGLGNSKQKYLYVSEPQNDFIFSIVCEELGFVGAVVIIFLFIALIFTGIMIAMRCKDRFGKILVTGIMAQIGLQVALNILVVSDALPNTGIALPFFSYGGTALMMLLLEIGVVLSVSRSVNQRKEKVKK